MTNPTYKIPIPTNSTVNTTVRLENPKTLPHHLSPHSINGNADHTCTHCFTQTQLVHVEINDSENGPIRLTGHKPFQL